MRRATIGLKRREISWPLYTYTHRLAMSRRRLVLNGIDPVREDSRRSFRVCFSLFVIIYRFAYEYVIFEKRLSNVSTNVFEFFVDFNFNDKQIDSLESLSKISAREKSAVSRVMRNFIRELITSRYLSYFYIRSRLELCQQNEMFLFFNNGLFIAVTRIITQTEWIDTREESISI